MTPVAIRSAVLLAPLLLVFSMVAPLAGQGLPPAASIGAELGFGACKLPCWAGITPGQTPFAQANERMAEHIPPYTIPVFLTTSTLSFETTPGQPLLVGSLYYADSRVSEIHLEVGLPLSYLLESLGSPDCVWASPGTSFTVLALFWEGQGLSTGAYLIFDGRRGWKLNMETRFLQMSTYLSCDTPGIIPWRGFARAWRYDQFSSAPGAP
jgi:hypothetical protein